MGLIEKRLIKDGKEQWIPGANKDLQEVTGGTQEFSIDWDTFENDAEALKNLQYQGMGRVIAGIRVVCRDELGKEALNEQVKTVVIRNTSDISAMSIDVADGTATFVIALGQGSKGYFREIDVTKALESIL